MITILAVLKAQMGKETELVEACALLVNEVRTKEEGNLMYIAHVTANDPTEIIFVEKYKDEQAMADHRHSAHFKEAGSKFKDLLAAPPVIKILNELE
ncbi:hypothetical protein JCM17380_39630 [Desulfosporosinus burensis]